MVTATTFGLLCVPTAFMGMTLPILVTQLHRTSRSVGTSLSLLYFINTIGIGSGLVPLRQPAVRLFRIDRCAARTAVLLNLGVAYAAFRLIRTVARAADEPDAVAADTEPTPETEARWRRYGWILFASFAVGFLSLSIEILWMRILSFTTGGRPSVFGNLLGFYLVGIALGAYWARGPCRRGRDGLPARMATLMITAAGLFYLVVPVAAQLMGWVGVLALPLFYFGAGGVAFLTGAVFPMLAHFAITRSRGVGLPVSGIYFANILGATLGPLLTGFYFLEWFSIERNVLHFALATLAVGLVLAASARSFEPVPRRWLVGGAVAGVAALLIFPVAYGRMMDRLYFKHEYDPKVSFRPLIQTRSGLVGAVPRPDGRDTVVGGGVYDGNFSIDLALDMNKISCAYLVPALHPEPKRILVIGLSSGSWTSVLLNHPAVETMDIVEINPGYVELMRPYPDQARVLDDPRVTIHFDDGRRWMMRNPDRKYDVMVMNTTFYWRSQSNNLLSREFLELLRGHLLPGGIGYYNTTSSGNAYYTAARVFPYVVQYKSFVGVSDSPFTVDPEEKMRRLARFTYRGQPILEWDGGSLLPHVEKLAHRDTSNRKARFLALDGNAQLITDDNLASEFKSGRILYAPARRWLALLQLWGK